MGFNREHLGQSTINGGFMGESWENHGNIFCYGKSTCLIAMLNYLPESMSLLWGDYFTDLTEVEESEGEQ